MSAAANKRTDGRGSSCHADRTEIDPADIVFAQNVDEMLNREVRLIRPVLNKGHDEHHGKDTEQHCRQSRIEEEKCSVSCG